MKPVDQTITKHKRQQTMSAHDTTLEDTFEEVKSEEVKSEEVKSEEDTFEEDTFEEDTIEEDTPIVHDINWEKKVRSDGSVVFIADLGYFHSPLSHDYIRVHADLIYSFLREHEDKDVLMSFDCASHLKLFPRRWVKSEPQYMLGYTHKTRANTRFIKLEEHMVEEAVKDLQSELFRKITSVTDFIEHYFYSLGVYGFSIIFKLKEKEEPLIVN